MTEPANYKDTLNLPKTSFDMKANLIQREPTMLQQWQKDDLYAQIRHRAHPKDKWVLHDGPPYANGDIHMGHLINKVLKDIVVKFRTLQGHDSPYVPGWDCHGLPIESAIQKELGPKFREKSKDEIRKLCHDYAMKYVGLQSKSFQRLGIFGDYARPYLTLDPKYEGGILDVLAELVHRDLVYRQKKPVHWCTNDRTALAEAELEYADRRDHSIYVSFKIAGDYPAFHNIREKQLSDYGDATNLPLQLLIWTTTPWTLPANRAIAVHPDEEYVFVWGPMMIWDPNLPGTYQVTLVASKLADKVRRLNGPGATVVSTSKFSGKELVNMGLKYRHPLNPSRLQPVVAADYVTMDDGTGLVHTAPGHGAEDYQTGKRNDLEIYNPVLPDGRYDDTVPDFLKGQTIWEANRLVIDKLRETGALFHHAEFNHSYPHCWRCKKPTIFRATEQWFVKASGNEGEHGIAALPTEPQDSLWQRAIKWTGQTDKTEFIPDWGRNRLFGMLSTRPDWCISRQRSWGVPIPAFFDEKGNGLLSEKTVRRVAEYFRQHGADSWYTHTPAQILGTEEWTDTALTPDGNTVSGFVFRVSGLTRGSDILDVWFESGASHHAVLECTHPELGYPAAMYLEGSDQHRGWFQSSLLEAAGYKSEPPYKQVLTHGFIVDGQGRKMSKSEGNDIKVEAALKEFGADILRLWVCSVDYQNDIPCSKELFKTIGESYRKIRNTIRYLLGNLYDFDPTKHMTPLQPHSIDQWMRARSETVLRDTYEAYDRYEFHRVFRNLYEFCNVEISAVYAKAIKDRLYCELPDSPRRRAAQSVCYHLLTRLIELLAPVLVFTAEEAWAAVRQLPGCATHVPSIHLSVINAPAAVAADSQASHWSALMPLIEKGNKQLDDLKRTIGLGNPLDAEAVIIVPRQDSELGRLMVEYGPEIEDALGVGFHRIEHGEIWDIKINDTREKYPSCARSWKRRPDVGSDKDYPDLSARDAAVVKVLRGK